jgi:hypothetical protein
MRRGVRVGAFGLFCGIFGQRFPLSERPQSSNRPSGPVITTVLCNAISCFDDSHDDRYEHTAVGRTGVWQIVDVYEYLSTVSHKPQRESAGKPRRCAIQTSSRSLFPASSLAMPSSVTARPSSRPTDRPGRQLFMVHLQEDRVLLPKRASRRTHWKRL